MPRWRNGRRGRRGRLAIAMAFVVAACSATAGPVKPEPGVGLPVDPASAVSGTRTRVPADSPRVSVAPPLPEADDPAPRRTPPVALGQPATGAVVRVLLGTVRGAATFSADVAWEVVRPGEASAVAAGAPGREWRIERDGMMLRVVRSDGAATPYRSGMLELRATGMQGVMRHGTAPYRGSLSYHATDSGVMVVNTVPVEAYLQGVVPREIGRERTMAEIAAVEAQAVAARSYVLIRLPQANAAPGSRTTQPQGRFDVRATVADQVYGGAAAETPLGNQAVANTRGLVLRYGGRTVNAPYHSTCGGSTAEAPEVWRTRGEPYLQRVSDRIPGTDRDYCAPSPRYRWTKALDAATLNAAVARHLREVQPSARGVGAVRAVRVASTTPSGRAAVTNVETTTGTYALRGNEARYVLRQPGGEILNSTYFSVVGPADARGGVRLEGRGYGHGIGMCQWGAIGRARAGQSFRTILQAYFPGTTVGPAS